MMISFMILFDSYFLFVFLLAQAGGVFVLLSVCFAPAITTKHLLVTAAESRQFYVAYIRYF